MKLLNRLNVSLYSRIIFVIFTIFYLNGCNELSAMFREYNTTVNVEAFPIVYNSEGKSLYKITCEILDSTAPDGKGDFSGITIAANGHAFPDTANSNYWTLDGVVELSEFDSLSITISHPLIGEIEESGIVPPSLQNFSISPSLPAPGIENEISEYTLSWTKLDGVDEYIPNIKPYDLPNGDGRGFIYLHNARNSAGFKLSTKDSEQNIIPFFRIWIETTTATPLMDLLGPSAFRIWSPTNTIDKTNLL